MPLEHEGLPHGGRGVGGSGHRASGKVRDLPGGTQQSQVCTPDSGYKGSACVLHSRKTTQRGDSEHRREAQRQGRLWKPEWVGQGLPRRGRDARPVQLLTGSRSRHSGLSWQRAKRTAQSGRGPSTRPGPGPHTASGEELGAFWAGGAWPGTRQVRGPSLPQGLARLSHLGPGPKPPLEPSLSLLLECQGGGERAWGKQSFQPLVHVHAEGNTRWHTHTKADTLRWTHLLCMQVETHRHYVHSQIHMDPHAQTHVVNHTLTHSDTYTHSCVHTETPPLTHPAHMPPPSVLLPPRGQPSV